MGNRWKRHCCLRQKKLVVCFIIARLIMSEHNLILSKEEQRDVFKVGGAKNI